MYLSDAEHLVKSHPNMFSVDGKFVGKPPPSEAEKRAVTKTTSRMRPWRRA
jgi:hypothetical protein